ncbi:Poly-gamma-glutamate biosynthesis protein PgsC [Leptospira santarosai]|nr:Poly-gamma-glutamate biosynthesis protein PgsC [Leptospira santarosai]
MSPIPTIYGLLPISPVLYLFETSDRYSISVGVPTFYGFWFWDKLGIKFLNFRRSSTFRQNRTAGQTFVEFSTFSFQEVFVSSFEITDAFGGNFDHSCRERGYKFPIV